MSRPVLIVDGKKMCGRSICPEQNPQAVLNFGRSNSTASGLRSWCKTCRRVESAKPEVKQRNRVRNQKRYEASGPEIRSRAAAWYRTNREAAIARISRYQSENREVVNARFRAYRSEGRYRHLDRAHQAKRRAVLAGVGAEHIDLLALAARDRWLCKLCSGSVDHDLRWPHPSSPSIDHVVPVSKGGAHVWLNVQLAHLRCNMRKGNRV